MFTLRECHHMLLSRRISAGALILLLGACAVAPAGDVANDVDVQAASASNDEDSDPQQDIASAVPDTDIFVFHIDPDTQDIVVAFDANVTNRAGYDNQPGYITGTNDFLFASILDGRQSDVYRYSEQDQALTQVTRTELSEYSPTSRSNGEFSTVVVEADGTQRLWRYDRAGRGVEAVRGDVTGVGYHAWLPMDQLAVFIVAEPLMHLDVLGTVNDSRYTLAVNPGRSLHARPQVEQQDDPQAESLPISLSFVQHREGEASRLMNWDGTDITFLVDMPEGVEDMTWLPDGRAVTVSKGKLLVWVPGSAKWQVRKDLSSILPGEVTRLAVNSSATRLAIVSSMESGDSQ